MARAVSSHPGISLRTGGRMEMRRSLPDEQAVAMVFDGGTLGVMMASPADLEDFALGFALSEGIVAKASEIERMEVVPHDGAEGPAGCELRMWLARDRSEALKARRRAVMGPVGCGLCGIDSLGQAMRDLPLLPKEGGARFTAAELAIATEALRAHQPMHDLTRAVHAAGFALPGRGITFAREDVGRHNALDKLIGALAREGIDPSAGAAILTSRVSIELVQKAVTVGLPMLVAVSAPTSLAVEVAEEAGLTLVGMARGGGFDIFTHPERIEEGACDGA